MEKTFSPKTLLMLVQLMICSQNSVMQCPSASNSMKKISPVHVGQPSYNHKNQCLAMPRCHMLCKLINPVILSEIIQPYRQKCLNAANCMIEEEL